MVCIGEECVRPLRTPDVRGKGISRTFQQVRVFEQMTVLDNILVILTTRKLGRALIDRGSADQSACAQSALEYVGLWEKRNDLASCLSYGQRKLLEIARVIAIDPEIILFDEPFAGLFKEMVEKVILILRELREKGKTIVLIEHNMDIIRSLSDHVIVMDGGRLLAQGKPESVLQRKEVIEAYLGE